MPVFVFHDSVKSMWRCGATKKGTLFRNRKPYWWRRRPAADFVCFVSIHRGSTHSKADINVCSSEFALPPKADTDTAGGNYSFVISFMVITPSPRSAVNETLSPGFTAFNNRVS